MTKEQQKATSLRTLIDKTFSRITRHTLFLTLFIAAVAMVAVVQIVLRPSYKEFRSLQAKTESALTKRNQELIKVTVEQGAANMVRVLGAAETAVQNLTTVFESQPVRVKTSGTVPLEKEFYPGGTFTNILSQHTGYEAPVTFSFPQLKLGVASDLAKIQPYIEPFLKAAKALHTSHPELKWLYLGSGSGDFLVFPASPMIPKDYDPSVRDWFKKAAQTQKLTWAKPYYTAGGNDLVLTVAQKLSTISSIGPAVVGVDVVMADIINQILATPYCDKCTIYLVDESGEVLAKKGDQVQGTSWQESPDRPSLNEEMTQLTNGENVDLPQLGQAVDSAAFHDGLSRSPKATSFAIAKSHLGFSAPITNLKWSLVGVVPAKYPGADGVEVMNEVSALVSSLAGNLVSLLIGILACLAVIILAVFRSIKRRAKSEINPIIDELTSLASALDQLKLDAKELGTLALDIKNPSISSEHARLVSAIDQMYERLKKDTLQRESLAVQAQLGKLAAQVAHDIRSPLTSMSASLENLTMWMDKSKIESKPLHDSLEVLKLAVARVNAILGQLLREYKNSKKGATEQHIVEYPKLTLVDKVIHDIVMEHKVTVPPNIELRESGFSSTPNVWGYVFVEEVQRAISNIIQNSVEAIGTEKTGIIDVKLETSESKTILKISDNGCGIPQEILPSIFERDFSYGKDTGTGLGLFQARAAVESIEGRISAESTLGKGTTFAIEIDKVPTPNWATTQIELGSNADVVFVDDDPSVLACWRGKAEANANVKAQYLTSADQIAALPPSPGLTVVLDHHFRNSANTGLKALKAAELNPRHTYLCTTAYDDPEIQGAANALGLKVIPKPCLAATELKTST